jgi:O-antigen ligase
MPRDGRNTGARRFCAQYWISVFLLLFLSLALLVPWMAFYRAFLFFGVFPLLLWAIARRDPVVGVTNDYAVWLTLAILGYITFGSFAQTDLESKDQYQVMRWALSTAMFVLAVLIASQRWLGNSLFYARLIISVVALSGASALTFYFWTGQYPGRISGPSFLSHPILGPASLISWWAIGTVLYRADERRRIYDYLIMAVSCCIVFLVVVLSQSRGPLVGLLVFVLAYCFSFLLVSVHAKKKWWILAGLATGFLLLGISSLLFDNLLATMTARGWSHRPQIWLALFNNLPDSIWIGAGMGSEFASSEAGRLLYENIGFAIKHPHNLLFGTLYYAGVVGTVLFLALLAWVFIRLLRLPGQSGRRLRPFALSLYALIVLLNMTDGHRLVAPPSSDWMFFWLPFIFLLGLAKFTESAGLHPPHAAVSRPGRPTVE